ncbi:hypothetical protein NBT05_03560 [Aquimarina sp. ERC-38]|uniref:hypothetical protein n=1 Tax=Aquimarina sp. ERC-38 TaxID=2949996 RepID=UPI0022459C04|nr:hypothetical protein [Aquimarina sp. ERC-38]UZO81558.1 hypothetical protein NBT05_03560 [Aquimarina sp. ERC-38]
MMKIIPAFYMLVTSLCATLCCPEEDDNNYAFGFEEFVNNDIIEINNSKKKYKVGDTIFVNVTIKNRQVNNLGDQIFLSDYSAGGESPSLFQYQLTLLKENAFNTISQIPILSEDIVIKEGSVESFGKDGISQLIIQSSYNGESFSSTFGLILKGPGNFYIADAFRKDGTVELSGRDFIDFSPNIRSVIINADAEGRFAFTVMP